MTVDERAKHEGLLGRIASGEKIQSADEMTPVYRENLLHLLLMQADRPEIGRLRGAVAARLRGALALSAEVTLVAPKTVPRSEGKAVRVVDAPRRSS